MSRPNQAEFTRIEPFEEAFKRRYGKDVEVYRAVTLNDNKTVNSVTIQIIKGEDKYVLTEMYDNNNLTDYVILAYKDKAYKHDTYLLAEIMVADFIGEKEYGNTN